MTAMAASGFTFVSWRQSCCVRGQASYFVSVQVRPNLTSVAKNSELLVAPLIVGTTAFRRYK
jgi:hypothetical protein